MILFAGIIQIKFAPYTLSRSSATSAPASLARASKTVLGEHAGTDGEDWHRLMQQIFT